MLSFLILGILLISVLWPYKKFVVIGFCILFLVAGIWRHQLAELRIMNNELRKYNDQEKIITLVGLVAKEPDIREKSVKLTGKVEKINGGNPEGIPSGSYGAGKKSIFLEKWPKYNPELIKEEKIQLIIQINGKVRDKIEVEPEITEEKAKELTLKRERVKRWIEKKEIKKIIFVPGKLINIVI